MDQLGIGRYPYQYIDPETGLIYLRARYYDTTTAQFLTRDALDALTRSAYGYVGGNPLNGTDPTGLKAKGVCIGGSISFLTHFTAQVCVVIDNHGGVGVTGDVGAGAGTPNIGAGVTYQTSNADHVRDLNGPFDYVGGSIGLVGIEKQFGASCSGKHITVNNYTVGKSWIEGEGHAGIEVTGVLASGGTDPCSSNQAPFNPFHPFGSSSNASNSSYVSPCQDYLGNLP